MNITTKTIGDKEVKMVEIPLPVMPTPPVQTIRADEYLKRLTTQQTNLQKSLDDVTAKIYELEGQGIELPKPIESTLPKIIKK